MTDTNSKILMTESTKKVLENELDDEIEALSDEELLKRYDYLIEDFKTMEELCLILREKRRKRGAIDFEFEESKIK